MLGTGSVSLWQLQEKTNSSSSTSSSSACTFSAIGNATILAELTGADCEPVYQIAANRTHIYTCSYNAVRVYEVNDSILQRFSSHFTQTIPTRTHYIHVISGNPLL